MFSYNYFLYWALQSYIFKNQNNPFLLLVVVVLLLLLFFFCYELEKKHAIRYVERLHLGKRLLLEIASLRQSSVGTKQ